MRGVYQIGEHLGPKVFTELGNTSAQVFSEPGNSRNVHQVFTKMENDFAGNRLPDWGTTAVKIRCLPNRGTGEQSNHGIFQLSDSKIT